MGPRTLAVLMVMATAPWGGGRVASAQVEQVPLTWITPAGCPPAGLVLAGVQRNLAESGDSGAPFVAAVTVKGPTAGTWRADLRIEARGGRVERSFQAESCDAIASAAALIIALSSVSGHEAPPPQPAQGPAVVGEARSPQAVDAEETVAGTLVPRDYWRRSYVSLMVSAVVDQGTMPNGPALGIEATVGPTWSAPGWRVRLLGAAGFFPSQHLEDSSGTGDFWMLPVSARGCVSAVFNRADLGLCAGGELVAMRGALGTVPGDVYHDTQFWLSRLGSAEGSWRVSPSVAVFGRAGVAIPGTQRSYHQYQYGTDFYQVAALAVRGALGIELRLD